MYLNGAVLLPVDMQQGFDEKSWPARWNKNIDAHGLAILDAWRRAAKPIVHVRHDSVEAGSTLRPERPGNQFRPGFAPQAGEGLVTKSVNSAFIATDLDVRLRRLEARSVYVFGISTDMCVSTTVRTGSNMGWKITLIEDACDCFDMPTRDGGTIPAREVHRTHVATLGFEFCNVVTTAELLQALQS
jgi:nicotinamidase-related amidase